MSTQRTLLSLASAVMLMTALVGTNSTSATPPDDDPAPAGCNRIIDEQPPVPCGDCPGFSFCFCWYAGGACPSARIMCNAYEQYEKGGIYTVNYSLEVCYWTMPCRSVNGGLCHPLNNPCETYGEETGEGYMYDYYQTSELCD